MRTWRENADGDAIARFDPERNGLDKPSPTNTLTQELQNINGGQKSWTQLCSLQLLFANNDPMLC